MYDVRYWLWLSLIFETGSPLCDKLLSAWSHNPKSIYEADKAALSPFCKNNEYILSRLLDKRLNRVYSILDFCQKENIGIITPESRNFPSSLLKIPSQPLVLYYKGRLPDFSRSLGVAVVGTRSVTPYGSSAAYTISHDLASAGAIVVSGMALGADTAAHRGALDAGGHTVAFLGCGIDIIYPKDNAKLMQEIISVGTVMTEYAPGLRPEGRHFPVRNRLISGVSNAVLVIEAPERSGALITASHGLKQGKLIYAVPGKVGELSSTGTNLLIQNGAKMVTSAKDIISDFSGLYEFRFSQGQSTVAKNSQNKEIRATYENTSNVGSDFNKAPFGESESTVADFNKNNFNTSTSVNGSFGAENGERGRLDTTNSKRDSSVAINNERGSSGTANGEHGGLDTANSKRDSFSSNNEDGGLSKAGFDKSATPSSSFINEPRSETFNNHVQSRRPERLVAAQPRPTILYNGMTEEEVSASYMSMETESSRRASVYTPDTERVFLTYPKEPMPKDGYQIELSEEGLRNFEKQMAMSLTPDFSEAESLTPTSPYKIENDPIKAARDKNTGKKKRLSFKRIKSEENESSTASDKSSIAPNRKSLKSDEKSIASDKKSDKIQVNGTQKSKPEVSYEGLNEMESKVLKFIFEKESVSVDGMASLDIPVSKLLATVTMLEIKQKITQKPGGYFEIKN